MAKAILFLLFLFINKVLGESLLDQKLKLEKSIEERINSTVKKIIGSENVVTFVKVDLEERNREETKKSETYSILREEEFLPGITYSVLPTEIGSKEIVVKSITTNIVVDKKIPATVVDRIKNEISTLIGIDPTRGDTVKVSKLNFAKEPTVLATQLTKLASNLYWIIPLFILGFVLLSVITSIARAFLKQTEVRVNTLMRLERGEQPTPFNPAPGAFIPGGPIELTLSRRRVEALPERGKGGDEMGKKFSFIKKENLKDLAFLLRDENSEKIAIICSYLPSELSSELMNLFSAEKQLEVASYLAIPKIIEPKQLEEIESDIKIKLEHLVGGEDQLFTFLEAADRRMQEKILENLENTNPILAAKIKEKLLFFEDLAILDTTSLQKVIAECQREGISLALALKNTSEEILNSIMKVLSEGGRNLLREQMDLLGEVTKKRIEEEQKLIVSIMKKLESEGNIIIDKSKRSVREKPEVPGSPENTEILEEETKPLNI